PYEELDPFNQKKHIAQGLHLYDMTEERVRRSRHAYYAMMSYIDDRVGELMEALKSTGLDENTVIIFTSDHGEMLGERGLWYKMSFFEWSARVPLLICAPRQAGPKRIAAPVSLIDLLPTLVDLAGGDAGDLAAPVDGHSLAPLLANGEPAADRMVAAEYLAEGAIAPCLMLRHRPHSESDYKYIASPADPDQLYNLAADPHELHNLADEPAAAGILELFRQQAAAHWRVERVHAHVLASQQQRMLVQNALMQGRHASWDFQPQQEASTRYMRNHLDLNVLERTARFPRPDAP
ncbi:MAG: sulfatase-like hydrolase/transferase, partial [Caldilineaceae bacterium]|nr:sulfatase-like hydrolase/transferase [Caldilineaceae bacterium]